MKAANTISIIILLAIMAGCGGRSKQTTDSSGTVDVIANSSEKEPTMQDSKEPMMQDVMDSEEIRWKRMIRFLIKVMRRT